MVMASISTIIHAYSLIHLYNQLTDFKDRLLAESSCNKIRVNNIRIWISCTIIGESTDTVDLYETFISILQDIPNNVTVSRAILHIVDTATYIGWIYNTKYAINVDSKSLSLINPYLYIDEDDILIIEADSIRAVSSNITKLSIIYDMYSGIYPNSFITDSQFCTLTELYIRLRGYNKVSITNIIQDILRRDLYQISVLILPFSIDDCITLLQKWPINIIGLDIAYSNSPDVEYIQSIVSVVLCTYDRDKPSGMLSDRLYNMYVPHNQDIMCR